MRPKKKSYRSASGKPQYTSPRAKDTAPKPDTDTTAPAKQQGWLRALTAPFRHTSPKHSHKGTSKQAEIREKLLRSEDAEPQEPKPKAATRAPRQAAATGAPGLVDRLRAWWQARGKKKRQPPMVPSIPLQPQQDHAQTKEQHSAQQSREVPPKAEKTLPDKPEQPQPEKKGEDARAVSGSADAATKPAAAIDTAQSVPLTGGQTFGTNLMRGQEFQFFDWKRASVVMGGVAVAAVAVAWGARWLVQRSVPPKPTGGATAQLQERREELAGLQEKVAAFSQLRSQAQRAQALLANHVYWSNFFSYLEGKTIPGVWYEKFNGETNSDYSLEAHARDFDTFVQQLHIWKDASDQYARYFSVSEVALEANDEGATSVNFSVKFAVKPAVFHYQER